MNLKRYPVNHVGIVVPTKDVQELEMEFDTCFVRDETQGCCVLFAFDNKLKTYKEFITQEGRAIKYDLGFHHVCYDLKDFLEYKYLHTQLIASGANVRLTMPEKSAAENNCNFVSFYFIQNIGIVEFNILDVSGLEKAP
jgi:hypothetical protein